jgi:dipeptidyl aminopeptidase/acylaminoacyl peptidase
LLCEVQSLLAAKQGIGDFMETPAMDVAARSLIDDGAVGPSAIPDVTGTQPPIGEGRFGPYRIEQKLSSGGMGEVFRAIDTRLGRPVAIKTCREGFGQRFQREAKAISSLNHPYICTLYDVGPDFLVMELIEGETLAARLKRGRLPLEQSIRFGSQIAEALAAAHLRQIVHRDLKPGNIIIAKTGIKVLDFGLARSPRDETVTAGHEIVGTPAYMAPEQFEGREAREHTDIYALGLVLREMLTGNRQGDMDALPPALTHVIERCLSADPDQRWQSASDVAQELMWAGKPSAKTPVSRRWPSRIAWIVPAAAALGFGAAVMWFRPWEIRQNQPVPVRVNVGLTRIGLIDGTFRMNDTILHREQPGTLMTISPDGVRIVVQTLDPGVKNDLGSPETGRERLAMRRLEESRFQPIAGTEDSTGPFFSADGKWIGFFGRGRLRKVPADGGAPVVLCEAGNFPSGSWGDDGNIIAALSAHGGLSRVPASGGVPVAVTNLKPGEVMHRWPHVLPGSHAVLFTSYTGGGPDDSNLEVLLFKNGERKILLKGGAMGRVVTTGDGTAYLIYLRQNTLFAIGFDARKLEVRGISRPVFDDVRSITLSTPGDFTTSTNGTLVYLSGGIEPDRSIFWMDASGTIQPLRAAPGVYNGLRFSPDGTRLVFSQGDPLKQQDLWVQDLETNAVARITRLPGASHSALWWPDGKYLIFSVFNQPEAGVYWTRSDGAGMPRLLIKENPAMPSAITHGGQLVWQSGNPMTRMQVSAMSLRDSGESLVVGGQTRLFEVPGIPMSAVSPDSQWIAYASSESGSDEIYVRPFGLAERRVVISPGGGEFPVWSPSGHELYYLLNNRIMVVEYRAEGGAFHAGKAHVWSNQQILDTGGPYQPYALAPDGKRFAVLLYPDGTADQRANLNLTYVVNFGDLLHHRLKTE